MGATIEAYNYKFALNVDEIAKGSRLTRTEFAAVNKVLREMAPETEKVTASLRSVEKALLQGHITAKQYSQSVELLKGKLKDLAAARQMKAIESTPVVGSVVKAAGEIPGVGSLLRSGLTASPGAMLATAGAAATAGAIGFGKSLWSGAGEQVNEVSEMSKSAKRLGMGGSEYMVLAEAAEKAKVPAEALEGAMYKMQVKLGEASAGSKDAANSFAVLGLDASKLARQTPTEALLQVSKALQGQSTASEQAATAQGIFGKSSREVINLLRMTRSEFEALRKEHEAGGQVMSDKDLARIAKAKEAVKESKEAWTGLTRTLAPLRAEADAAIASVTGAVYTWMQKKVSGFADVKGAYIDDPGKAYREKEDAALAEEKATARREEILKKIEKLEQDAENRRKRAQAKLYEHTGVDPVVLAAREELAAAQKLVETNPELQKRLNMAAAAVDLAERENIAAEKNLEAYKKQTEQRKKLEDVKAKAATLVADLRLQEQLYQKTGGHLQDQQHLLTVYRLQLDGLSGDALKSAKSAAEFADRLAFVRKITEDAKPPAEKYREELQRLNRAFSEGVGADRFLSGAEKLRKELLQGFGISMEQFKSPAQKFAEQMRNFDRAIDVLRKAGQPFDDLVVAKRKAEQEFAKPIKINISTLGMDAAQRGTDEAFTKIEEQRLQDAATKRRDEEVAKARRGLDEEERKRKQFIFDRSPEGKALAQQRAEEADPFLKWGRQQREGRDAERMAAIDAANNPARQGFVTSPAIDSVNDPAKGDVADTGMAGNLSRLGAAFGADLSSSMISRDIENMASLAASITMPSPSPSMPVASAPENAKSPEELGELVKLQGQQLAVMQQIARGGFIPFKEM